MNGKRPSEFQIEPHEVAALQLVPQTPLRAPVSHYAFGPPLGLGGPFALRRVESVMGFDFWVARACFGKNAPLLSCGFGDQGVRKTHLAFNAGDFLRKIWFDARGHLIRNPVPEKPFARLMIGSDGTLNWDKDASPDNRHIFSWRARQNSEKTPSAAWRAHVSEEKIAKKVAEMLADGESDCAFSWRWMSLLENQRRHLKWKLIAGSWDECEQVLRAILWRDWEFGDKDVEWYLFGPGIERFSPATHQMALQKSTLWSGDWHCVEGQWTHHHFKPTERQLFCLGLAQQRFGWHLDPRFHLKSAIKPYLPAPLIVLAFSVPAPTGHERIEAGVFLKTWASQ